MTSIETEIAGIITPASIERHDVPESIGTFDYTQNGLSTEHNYSYNVNFFTDDIPKTVKGTLMKVLQNVTKNCIDLGES